MEMNQQPKGTKAMEEQGQKEEKTFGEGLGCFTVERLNARLDRLKTIIDGNDFRDCRANRIKDAWEALIEVAEILAAGLIIQARRPIAAVAPKTVRDRLWAVVEKSPLSAALIFLGVVILKVFGHGDAGNILNVVTKGVVQ